jgi:hypothetical protein
MDCLIAFALSCVFRPENAFVSVGVHSQISSFDFQNRWCARAFDPATANTRQGWCTGPMGEVRIGMIAELPHNLELRYGIEHTSYINTNGDKGIETVFATLTWRPFR